MEVEMGKKIEGAPIKGRVKDKGGDKAQISNKKKIKRELF